MPSPPHSHTSDDESQSQALTAKFEEWPLGQAVLKRITIDGSVTFQLQFTWDPCSSEQDSASRVSHMVGHPGHRAPNAIQRAKGGTARSKFTLEEDKLILTLKDQALSWEDIHIQHKEQFQERAVGCLQVRYSTKLKNL